MSLSWPRPRCKSLSVSGDVDQATFDKLVEPMVSAIKPRASAGSLTDQVLGYMKGQQGQEWAWCAGFATSLLAAANATQGVPAPYPYEI